MLTIKFSIRLLILLLFTTYSHADRVIAQGQHAQLTEDNALALFEATEFVLQQLGVQQLIENIDEQDAVAEIADAFPNASAQEQQVVSQARQYWNQAQGMWSSLSLQSKRAFAYDVLLLSLGPAAANQLLGGNPATGSTGSASARFNATGGADMPSLNGGYEGSGCWASAGCTGYDSSTDTYSHESYDYSSGGYSDY